MAMIWCHLAPVLVAQDAFDFSHLVFQANFSL